MTPDPLDEPTDANVIRLFPLPGVVLFPHAMLPLRIFETRYLQMTEDALTSDRRFAMILPKLDGVDVSSGPLPLVSVGCIGKIVHTTRMLNGEILLVLRGEARVRLIREVESPKLYRTARADVLHDVVSPHHASRRQWQRLQITRLIRRLLPDDHELAAQFVEFLTSCCPAGVFADMVSYASPLSVATKQKLLEAVNVDDRLELLLAQLEATAGCPPAAASSFPPIFSRN